MVTPEQITELRLLIGESIPVGGSDVDSLLTNVQLTKMIEDSTGNLERAAYEGWRVKAAQFANLVDVTDGAASRSMSDLLKNATDMVKLYAKSSTGPTEGRTRVGRIVRK